MRVMLILPFQMISLVITNFPSGFAYLASALKSAGHEVVGVNPNNLPKTINPRKMILDSLRKNQPQLIGIGGLCGDYSFLKGVISLIREFSENIPIVCGGKIIDNDAEFVFQSLHPDFCIIGEGEEVLVQLVNLLESGREDFEIIPNLGYWKDGSPKFTKENFDYGDINARSFPDYSPFGIEELLDKYSLANNQFYRYSRPYPRVMIIITARSCPFNCSFCVHQHGSKYRARSIENIIEEICFLYEKYRFNILSIQDELFAGNKKRFNEFCNAIAVLRNTQGLDFDWMFQTHASAGLGYDELLLAKETGCYNFCYGVESGSPTVLKSMNKKTKLSQFIEAIQIAHEVKIGFSANLIFGDVAETPETFLESLEFFLKYCLDTNFSVGMLRPFPGSKLFNYCIEKGLIDKPRYYEKGCMDDINMTSMPSNIWLTWLRLFCKGIFGKHLRTVEASHCYKEDLYCFDIYKEGRFVWQVRAQCPHCGHECFYRELTYEGDCLPRGCTHCHKVFRIRVRNDKSDGQNAEYNGQRELSPELLMRITYDKFLYFFRNTYPKFQPVIKQIIIEKAASLYSSGKENEAISYMTSALEGMPMDMECECTLTEYLVKKNKLREAVGRLNRVIEAFPNDETAKMCLKQLTNAMQ